jgi:hypothetical protein
VHVKKIKRNRLAMLAASAALASGSAQAITVAGVSWDEHSLFDFAAQTLQVSTVARNAGDPFRGYGQITALNGNAAFCAGCELTYVFSGFTLNAGIGSAPNTPFAYSGGRLQIYVDSTRDFSATSAASAADGQLWLDMVAADPFGTGATLTGSTTIPNGSGMSGYGASYMNVVGGLAASVLDTNGEPGGTDFLFTTSYQALRKAIVQNGVAYGNFGTSEFSGVSAVPEAGTYAMMLAGLGLVGWQVRRRQGRSA